jgi:hypothetical protein
MATTESPHDQPIVVSIFALAGRSDSAAGEAAGGEGDAYSAGRALRLNYG